MSGRPKRKATNRSYNDSIDESIFEEQPQISKNASGNAKRRSNKKESSSTGSLTSTPASEISQDVKGSNEVASNGTSSNGSSGSIPYNWQPLPEQVDYFSHKLNLKAAFVDVTTQTLCCPNQHIIAQNYDDSTSIQPVNSNNSNNNNSKRRKSFANKEVFKIKKHDFIYMVSEPPGEPYYIGSVMGFTRKEGAVINNANGSIKSSDPTTDNAYEDASNFVFKIQWYYRPRDISKSTSDSRLLYASMHTDTCPLLSFRGLVSVKHKQDIENGLVPVHTTNIKGSSGSSNGNGNSSSNSSSSSPAPVTPLEIYSLQPNCFYFEKLFDRYMIKFYDIILTKNLLIEAKHNDKNQNFLKALNKRFEFIFVESTISKAFISSFSSSSCNCEKCGQWCSNQDSVNCVVCDNHYHMHCLDPPLLKKPSRGFSWSCALCTKKYELEHQRKKMIMLSHDNKLSNEMQLTNELSTISSPVSDTEDQENGGKDDVNEEDEPLDGFSKTSLVNGLPKFESMAIDFLKQDSKFSLEQRRIKEEWNMRYLGMHARLEDGVDIEDRSPYPRALTRLGARHQATNIPECDGHPLVYYDNEKTLSVANGNGKKKSNKKSRKVNNSEVNEAEVDPAFVKLEVPDEFEDLSEDEYPEWLQPRPKGYLERGEDDGEGRTCTLLFKPSQEDFNDDFTKLDSYVEDCYPIAEKKLRIIPTTPNFMDAILKTYMENDGDVQKSMKIVNTFTRQSLSEPTFSKEEIKKFEEGVRKNGSELYPTFKEVKTQPCAMIVRYYYLWKKTPNGRKIWGNFEGRIQKKLQNIKDEEKVTKPSTELDFLASTEDDSSYENDRIQKAKNIMTCKHCSSHQSILWYRITGHDANSQSDKDKNGKIKQTLALCFRCARLWRRYAVVWEDPQEVKKKNTRGAGGWKKKVEFELVRDSEKLFLKSQELGGGFNYNDIIPESSVVNLPVALAPLTTKKLSQKPKSGSNSKKTPATPVDEEEPPKKKRNTAKKNSVSASTIEPSKEVKLELDPKVTEAITPVSTKSKGKKSADLKASVDGKKTAKTTTPKSAASASTKKEVNVKTTSKLAAPSSSGASNLQKNVKSEESSSKAANGKRKRETDSSQKNLKKSKDSNEKVSKDSTDKSTKSSEGKDDKVAVKKARKPKTTTSKLTGNNDSATQNATTAPGPPQISNKTSSNENIVANSYKNYVMIKLNKKGEKKLIMTKEILKNTIDQFRPRQLLEVGSQLPIYQAPSGAMVDLPFSARERNCSVCQEVDEREESLVETLICSNCGVNAHASCVGATIPNHVPKPVKEWLCEPCINDLNPQFSTLYSCSLCLANESNYELTMLGSNKVKPDYLKPISDSGRWCHVICALFNFEDISFKSMSKKGVTKYENTTKADGLPDRVMNTYSLESTSEVYLKSYDTKCGICRSSNGSLVECDLCNTEYDEAAENQVKYHPTCAQDASNFKVGFKLVTENHSNHVDKETRLVKIGDAVGRIKPVIICSKHHNVETGNFINFRDFGRRVHSGERKLVVQLFIEDILRSTDTSNKLSGPQAKANNYIKISTMFKRSEKRREEKSYFRVLKAQEGNKERVGSKKVCKKCKVTVSPMWWPKDGNIPKDSGSPISSLANTNGSDDNNGVATTDSPELEYLCQVCFHEEKENDEVKSESSPSPAAQSQNLLEILSEPLTAEKFGLKSNADKLPINNFGRSRISLGDLLT